MSDLAALILAAGRGNRLRPLTDATPKPLLPVGGVPLLDLALARVALVLPVNATTVAVNAHHLADQIVAHVGDRAHVSIEQPDALGTAGAVGALREWIDGRDLLVANGDVWFAGPVDVRRFVDSWDRARPRLLVVEDAGRPDFDERWRFAGLSLLPWSIAQMLQPVPSGLYEVVWSHADLDLVPTDVAFVDCGTLDDYDLANRLAVGPDLGQEGRAAGV